MLYITLLLGKKPLLIKRPPRIKKNIKDITYKMSSFSSERRLSADLCLRGRVMPL
jgi:hypothetical protein